MGAEELQALLSRVATLPETERDAAVAAHLVSAGGTPLSDDGALVVLARARDGREPRLIGDLNQWGERPERPGRPAGFMEPLEGTSWFLYRTRLGPRARVEYRLAWGETEEPDPHNPFRAEGWDGPNSELRGPDYAPPPEVEEAPGLPRGRVVSERLRSEILGNERDVHVYLPPGYTGADGVRYPTAWFGDGTLYLERARVPTILDNAIAAGRVRPLIAVLVDPGDRRSEYRGNPRFRRFVSEELVPWVDSRYPTRADSSSRAVLGGSRGGLAAADLAFHLPDVFGLCGAIAPATSSSAMARIDQDIAALIRASPRRAVRFHVLVGTWDLEWRPDGIALRDALEAKGYEVSFREIPEGHNLTAWRAWIDDILAGFFPGEASP